MVDGGMLSNFPIEVFDRIGRAAAALADVRHQALGEAGRRATPDVSRCTGRSASARAMVGTHDELPRPDPHRRAVGRWPGRCSSTPFGVQATDFAI